MKDKGLIKIDYLHCVEPGLLSSLPPDDIFTTAERAEIKSEKQVWDDILKWQGLDEICQIKVHFCTEEVPLSLDGDMTLVGGSSHDAREDLSWIHNTRDLLRFEIEDNKPVLAICFGFQLMIQACGGELVDFDKYRFGGTEITLSKEGRKFGPLRDFMHDPFIAIRSHRQYASNTGGCQVLATNEDCVQIVSCGVAMGVQFHPEFTPTFAAVLMKLRRKQLRLKRQDLNQLIASLPDSNPSMDLIGAYVRYFFRPSGSIIE